MGRNCNFEVPIAIKYKREKEISIMESIKKNNDEKTAAIFLAEGFETVEALAVVDLLRRAGINICMVSVTDDKNVTTSHGITVVADALLKDVDFDSLDMMILPGGMPGTLNLEKHAELMKRLDSFNEKGGMIAAICAAPSILAHRGILKGIHAGAYPGYEKDLEDGGAIVSMNSSTTDGRIITARGMGCAVDFGLDIIAMLKGQSESDRIRKAIVAC